MLTAGLWLCVCSLSWVWLCFPQDVGCFAELMSSCKCLRFSVILSVARVVLIDVEVLSSLCVVPFMVRWTWDV